MVDENELVVFVPEETPAVLAGKKPENGRMSGKDKKV